MKNFKKEHIGILAGGGFISILAIQKALQEYHRVVVIGLKDNINNIEQFKKIKNIKFYETYPGYLKRNLKILKKEKINRILFIGKINKPKTFKEKKFDLLALKLLLTLKDKSDYSILQRLVKLFSDNGIKVISQKDFFNQDIVPPGYLTRKKCNKKELENIKYGFNIAKKVASLGIGQSIIVENKMVIAVEGIEGTDEMIKRASKYVKDNSIFIKVSKPKHNPKFDLPGFGLDTLKLLLKNNIKTIALESGWVLLIEREKIIQFANKHKMKIIGIN